MLTGRIVRFDEERGFGFIAQDGGSQEDVFFHIDSLSRGWSSLAIGTRVTFDVMEGQRGLKAYNLHIVDNNGGNESKHAAEAAVAPTVTATEAEEMCDVLTEDELRSEVTERLLQRLPGLTAEQIQLVREDFVALASKHGWIVE
ncbi:cold-shock protein [Saccharopolyspora spinosa]|uniref:Cold shock CspA family protein n=1 Tax=Saccharopolyspora spinosa TaxID=60894 RepID=A0A2N3Y521_SACSN|nr:cold shock domain-containing protein [Saccharopolyspora spinosa]PKW18004.1 cold shock CspA family protein [Saccharopolyspora spinosa]